MIPVTIYVGHDTRVDGIPNWLRRSGDNAFKKTSMMVKTNDAAFRLFERRFSAGTITLGGNSRDAKDGGKSNYIIIVRPAGLPRLARPTKVNDVLAQLPQAEPERGRALYFAMGGAGCAKCHRADESGLGFGPDLANLTKRQDPKHIVESILLPSAQIKEGFAMQTIHTDKGTIVNGLLREETGQALTLITADGKLRTIGKAKIERRKSDRVSAMPSFDRLLTPKQVADITAWLLQRKN